MAALARQTAARRHARTETAVGAAVMRGFQLETSPVIRRWETACNGLTVGSLSLSDDTDGSSWFEVGILTVVAKTGIEESLRLLCGGG